MPAPKPTTDQREFRALTEGLEIRAVDGATDTRTATGYAVLYGSLAECVESAISGRPVFSEAAA